jgi:tRNA(His) 5'-end guanylyltransferase
MKFEDLDRKMRVFETADDHCILPGMHIVVRIDGRGFTHLTKEVHQFEAPYDERFRDMMVETTRHLMNCGFKALYGYTQSDEISIVLHQNDETFGRKTRKLVSILAGEASARFSLLIGSVASFDCRISQFPKPEMIVDYLRWRQEDAYRNFINGHCYWALRKAGQTAQEATAALVNKPVWAKKSIICKVGGLSHRLLPNWQKHGIGVSFEDYEIEGVNPMTGAAQTTLRRRLKTDDDLPTGERYSELIRSLLESDKRSHSE